MSPPCGDHTITEPLNRTDRTHRRATPALLGMSLLRGYLLLAALPPIVKAAQLSTG